jgi:hypothetical protein
MVYWFLYHVFINKMKSKTKQMQTKNKHTHTVRIANSSLVPKYSRKIAETDTLNAYTNNEKKTRFP